MHALAARGVRDLIVILQIADEVPRRDRPRRRAAALFLPRVPLALIEKIALRHGHEFVRGAEVVGVVRLALVRERDARGVVPVVVPEHVDAVLRQQAHVLRLVFRDDEDAPPRRRLARAAGDQRDHVLGAVVVDRLRGIEAEAVEAKLVDPIRRVLADEFAHRGGAVAIVVDRLAPIGRVLFREVRFRELREIAAVGAEVVVDDVEEHAEAESVRGVDEGAEIVGRAVEPRRRPEVDAVVAPTEAAGEVVDGHDFEQRHAGVFQQRQFLDGRAECALSSERADVHFVDDGIAYVDTLVPPRIRRIDDHRRPMRPLGLKARCGVGKGVAAETKFVERAGARSRALRRRRRRRPIRAPAPRRERARRRRSARRRWESGVASRRQSCKLSAVNLLHLFDLSLRARAADAALEWAGETYTFADVESRSNRVARALQAAGFAKGDRLCVHLANRIELIDLYLACVKLGVIFVPINVLYRERELAHIMSDAEPRALITSDNLPEPAADDSRPATEIDGDDPAAIIYTSGTTGTSKGAVLTHNNFAANAVNLLGAWQISDRDRFLLPLPLFHIHALGNGLHCWLVSGCRMRLLERFDHRTATRELLDFRPTLFFGVPTVYVRLLDTPADAAREIGAAMRLFVSGSAPLPPHVFAQFRELFGHTILERYGMTETFMTMSNPYVGERRPGTVGFPLPGVSARIVDGELHVKGPTIFDGYWRKPDANAAAFDGAWFRTGDLAERSADGYVPLRGRKSDLIIPA